MIAHIRKSIREGRFAPGQRLIESELQLALGVSRGPIREAIRRLSADNILQIELHKGARVRRLTAAEIKSSYEVREALEGLACRLAAENRKPSDTRLSTLERTFDETFDGTAKSYLHYNGQFHRLIFCGRRRSWHGWWRAKIRRLSPRVVEPRSIKAPARELSDRRRDSQEGRRQGGACHARPYPQHRALHRADRLATPDRGMRRRSMIPENVQRFSEKHALGL